MSLLTHADAVPWGESMRLELTAGHMPPWSVDRGIARVRNPGNLTARELNVLLTWATGGTPPGDVEPPATSAITTTWSLGSPDAMLTLPQFNLTATEQERTAEFVLPGVPQDRAVRAVDLLPGTPSIVRSATIELRGTGTSIALQRERVLTLWVPGDPPSPLTHGALRIPANVETLVRVRYRKTWEYEGRAMTDQSRVGLYFAMEPADALESVSISPGLAMTLPRAMRAIAVYPDPSLADVAVSITATRPNGQTEELIAFHPRQGWTRRYWFREPLPLPRGTRLSVRVTSEPPALLPPALNRPSSSRPATARVTVDVVP